MPSKFLNISTDTTLGGSSASDDTVSSQKAIKAYVDSQTGTAPAFANITGQPTDNTNLASALNAKYDASNPNGYTNNVGTVTSVNNTSPDSGGNVTLSIPTVNNATLTIQKNGTTVNTFTANASSDVTANIAVPTKTSDLTNDDGFITGITSSDVTTALGYTPYNSTNPNGYQANVIETVKVNGTALTPSSKAVDITVPAAQVNSDWNAVSGVAQILNKPTIPTVNNATLTITQGGTTKGTFTANASSNVTIDLDAGGSSRNIGEIIQSTIPLTDAGLHLLDGSLISGSGSYSAFVTYIAGLVSSYPDLFETEANWQTSVTNYGVCGKFVYDSVNNTVRLPKRASEHGDLIKSYSSGSDWYRIYSDGWCEQGGTYTNSAGDTQDNVVFLKPYVDTNYYVNVVGIRTSADADAWVVSIGAYNITTTGFATKLNATYWSSTKWEACGYIDISDLQQSPVYEYIVIATATKTDIEVDIDEIATDLNGKADTDLSNTDLSSFATKLNTAGIRTVVETYVNGTDWYRIWSDGWIEQGGDVANSGSNGYSRNTVIFLKPFSNTKYTLTSVANKHSTQNGIGTAYPPFIYTKSTNQCVFGGYCWDDGFDWYACGY